MSGDGFRSLALLVFFHLLGWVGDSSYQSSLAIRSVVSFDAPSPGLRPPSPNGRGAGGEGAGAEGRTHATCISNEPLATVKTLYHGEQWEAVLRLIPASSNETAELDYYRGMA